MPSWSASAWARASLPRSVTSSTTKVASPPNSSWSADQVGSSFVQVPHQSAWTFTNRGCAVSLETAGLPKAMATSRPATSTRIDRVSMVFLPEYGKAIGLVTTRPARA
jgi:hypothetical protein